MIQITFPKKKQKKFKKNISGLEIAKYISDSFARSCVAIIVNNETLDLNSKLINDATIRFITKTDPEGIRILRHTAAHVMAQAILNIYPKAQLTIGPVIKDGFYYDVDMDPLTTESLDKIEIEMRKIIDSKTLIIREEISKLEALKFYKKNPYKSEIISNLENQTISIYKQGSFVDLCEGPHLLHTGLVKFVKLLRVSGAYWRADNSKQQLQRIYGTAFFSKKELKTHLHFLDEAKKRNHRKIATDMDLLSFHGDAPGMPLFHPNGINIWNSLLAYWREEHIKEGYSEIKTPIILHRNLWEKSGHWENYKDNMYTTVLDNQNFAIKPMNCPGCMLFYKSKPHSYKSLPMKIAEIGLVHRHELSGVLNGLLRARSFHQDDAHIFMHPDHIEYEVLNLLKFSEQIYKTFGLGFEIELSTRPNKSIGTHEQWEYTTNSLKSALEAYNHEFRINSGDGAFYGPKIDLHIKDALNRTWQCGTLQLDISLPKKFDLYFINKNNEKQEPVVLHRAIFGSIERFFGILIEHFAGKFPLWLAPIQTVILPINDSLTQPSEEIASQIRKFGIRTIVNSKAESLNKKIREAQLGKIPLILIYGTKENKSKTLSVRTLNGKVKTNISMTNFIDTIVNHIAQKKITLNIFGE